MDNYNLMSKPISNLAIAALLAFVVFSAVLKVLLLKVGAPFTTIDDHSTFNSAFLTFFGEAPPQRTYLEAWLVKISSLFAYLYQSLLTMDFSGVGLNVVPEIFRDYTNNPLPYVVAYRIEKLLFDFGTAVVAYLIVLELIPSHPQKRVYGLFSGVLYLLSYNVFWSDFVARPDVETGFFAVLGFWFYLRSDYGKNKTSLIISAILVGTSTGLKLHGAMLAIFIALDILRQQGWRQGWQLAFQFSLVSFCLFLVTAGTTLFDPLLYVKMRLLNAKDDISPWIKWGEQFYTILEGTGFIVLPISIVAAIRLRLWRSGEENDKLKSTIFISLLFLLVFCSIRQLRGYWMIPALPLFYSILATCLAKDWKNNRYKLFVLLTLPIMAFQTFGQFKDYKRVDYKSFQRWVTKNVAKNEVIYIVGYDTLYLPCNSLCLKNRRAVLQGMEETALQAGETFTSRHIRLWEERVYMVLTDMLDRQNDGYNYYGMSQTPLSKSGNIVFKDDIEYLVVLEGYPIEDPMVQELVNTIPTRFDYITTVVSPGGKDGMGGMSLGVYKRKRK